MGGYGPNYRYLKHVRPGYAEPFKCLVPDKDLLIRNLNVEASMLVHEIATPAASITIGDDSANGGSKDATIFSLPLLDQALALSIDADMEVDNKVLIINDAYGKAGTYNVTITSASGKKFTLNAGVGFTSVELDAAFESMHLVYSAAKQVWLVWGFIIGIPG